MTEPQWPRIRDLPEHERRPFHAYLMHQTVPTIEWLPMSEQDGYYEHDYNRWKAGLPVDD